MRLIDADALIKKWENVNCEDVSFEMAVIGAINDIKKEPTVDAVPIIRCRECRWGRDACGNIECNVDLNIPSEYHGYDWYCPNGERKEHETD